MKQKSETTQKGEKVVKKKHIYVKNDTRDQSPADLSDDGAGNFKLWVSTNVFHC